MTIGSSLLALVAGVLSIFSPCVLPILPVVLAAAASERRWGTIALGCGLSLSFVAIGLFLATIGRAVGLDADRVRDLAAVLVVAVGVILVLPPLQARLAFAAGPVGNWTGDTLANLQGGGAAAQFLVGLLLGAVWSPCVGPTLGAASLLAAQGRDLPQVALIMVAFGIGAALPLVLLGLLSRATLMRVRGRLMTAGKVGKGLLGAAFIFIGIAIISGADKRVEATLVNASPQWLTQLTTSF